MRYGYVRVSTKEQKIDRQLASIFEDNILEEHIFIDYVSGKDFKRIEYQKLMEVLKEDDELVIKSIDRLGRNYDEIIEQWQIITRRKKVHITVLDFPLLNTKLSENTLTSQLISDIVLQVLSYVAQFEREQIRQRQLEGIREAKKRGTKFGRPKLEIPEEFEAVVEKYYNHEITIRDGARLLGISKSTFYNWLKCLKK